MVLRCKHCGAETSVADATAASMCMRCGQTIEAAQSGAVASPAAAAPNLDPAEAAPSNDFDGSLSTVMVQRPQLGSKPPAAGSPVAKTVQPGGTPASAPIPEQGGWHAVLDGAQQGPMDARTLAYHFQRQTIGPKTLLWRNGMAAWTPLENLPDALAALQAAAPVDSPGGVQALLHLVEEAVERIPEPAAPATVTPVAAPTPQAPGAAPSRPTGPAPGFAATTVVPRPAAASNQRRWLLVAIGLAVGLAALAAGLWAMQQGAGRAEPSTAPTAPAAPASAVPPAPPQAPAAPPTVPPAPPPAAPPADHAAREAKIEKAEGQKAAAGKERAHARKKKRRGHRRHRHHAGDE